MVKVKTLHSLLIEARDIEIGFELTKVTSYTRHSHSLRIAPSKVCQYYNIIQIFERDLYFNEFTYSVERGKLIVGHLILSSLEVGIPKRVDKDIGDPNFLTIA